VGVRVEGALADDRRRWGLAAGRPAAAGVSGEASVRGGGVRHAATSGSSAGAATQRPTLPVFKWWVGVGCGGRPTPAWTHVEQRASACPPATPS